MIGKTFDSRDLEALVVATWPHIPVTLALEAQWKGRRAAMERVGMDLGKKETQVAIITESGELIEKRMRTERGRLTDYFKDRLGLPPQLKTEIAPLLAMLAPLNEQIGIWMRS